MALKFEAARHLQNFLRRNRPTTRPDARPLA